MNAPQVPFEERIDIEEPEGRPQEGEMRGAGGAQPDEFADGVRIVGGRTEILSAFLDKGKPSASGNRPAEPSFLEVGDDDHCVT